MVKSVILLPKNRDVVGSNLTFCEFLVGLSGVRVGGVLSRFLAVVTQTEAHDRAHYGGFMTKLRP